MQKLIKNVLDKYNTPRSKISNTELAMLIVSHMNVGLDGEKGWYLDLSSLDGKQDRARDIIAEYK